jgi:myo-inositol-1(or 4)-monophosphatase
MTQTGHAPYHSAGSFAPELAAATEAAVAGGRVVADFYERAAASTYEKGDGSPVTDADLASDRAIREILGARFPDDPILSEEGADDRRRVRESRCWIVDPLDGTEQFILRTGEFDVLVALAVAGRPVVAAGYQPTTATLITAVAGHGAWVRRDQSVPTRLTLEPAPHTLRLASSKWFGAPENAPLIAAIAARLGITPGPPGVTGFSPRMFPAPREIDAIVGIRPGSDQVMASEWDFAATDLVIHEAGGRVTDLDGELFRYNKPVPRNVGGLIAAADPATHERVLAAAHAELSRLRGYP